MFRLYPLLLILLLSACSSSHLLTGTPRAPIDPMHVQIYHVAPQTPYEEIAQLTTNSGAFTYGEQNKVNSVMNKLRTEAAKLGANGVLFVGATDGPGGSAISLGGGTGRMGGHSFSSGGVGVSLSPKQKNAVGIAIYVPDAVSTNATSDDD